jgi:hypothetical protein
VIVYPPANGKPCVVTIETTTRAWVETEERVLKEKEGALAAEQHVPELNLAVEQEKCET